jgi:O-antigen/teichoic acid export membrane protein
MFAAATTQLTNLLNAIGRIRITFFLMIMWTTLTWVFIPLLAMRFGVNGAALGYSLVGSSSLIAIYIAKKHVNFSLYHSVGKPLIGTGIMATVLVLLRIFLPLNSYSIIILSLVGSIVYVVVMVALVGASLVEDAKKSFKTVIGKKIA